MNNQLNHLGRTFGTNSRSGFSPDPVAPNRADILAKSLGVVLDTLPQIGEIEGEKARQAGIDARILGVERENANEANKSIFAPIFRGAAEDAFDHQDAQFDAPMLAIQEADALQELRGSENPEDFKAFIAAQDARIAEMSEGRSAIYRKALVEQMTKARENSAATYTGWLGENRQTKAGSALGAQVQAILRSGGDVNAALKSLLDSAPARFGVGYGAAREIVAGEIGAYSDMNQDGNMIANLDHGLFTTAQRQILADRQDAILSENETLKAQEEARQNAILEAQVVAEKAKSKLEEDNGIRQYSATLRTLASGEGDPEEAIRALSEDPYWQRNPEKFSTMLTNLRSAQEVGIDPLVEGVSVRAANEAVVSAVFQGEDPYEVALDFINRGEVKSPKAQSDLMEAAADAKNSAEALAFEDISDYEQAIGKAFRHSASEGDIFGGPIFGSAPVYVPEAAPSVTREFREELVERTTEWYKSNPEYTSTRIPKSARRQITEEAYAAAEAWGLRKFGEAPEEGLQDDTGGTDQGSALDELNGIITGNLETDAAGVENLADADVDDVINSLSGTESGGNFAADRTNNDGRRYSGRLQFGDERLADYERATGRAISLDEFQSNPQLQQEVERWHVRDIKSEIKDNAFVSNAIGTTINGITVTEKGLIAVAHLGGVNGMKQFVATNGEYDPADQLGTKLSTYLRKHAG